MILKTLVTGVAAAAAVVAAAAGGVTSIASRACRPPRRSSRSCGTFRCRRHRRLTCRPRCCRPSTAWLPAARSPGKATYIEGGIGRIEGMARRPSYNNAAAKGMFPLIVHHRQHRPERPAPRRPTSPRRPPTARRRQPEHPFVAGPQPDRLADLQAVALALLMLGCRLGPSGAWHPCRSPERRHDRGGARA